MKKMILSGNDWHVTEAGGGGKSYPSSVPGDIHNDLLIAGVIEDPYYADNSKKCGWVVERDWSFSKTFTVDGLEDVTELVFDGIDTVSTIYLNGREIAKTDNMFMQYRIDVSNVINKGINNIEVVIHSIRKELEKYPSENYFGCFNVPRIFVRKAQCHFSWDWAPDFPATGIWKDVYLETRHDTYIHDYKIKTELDGNVTFFVNMPESSEILKARRIEIDVDGKTYTYDTTAQKNFFTIKIEEPRLWWPRFLGDQPLYDYSIRMYSDGVLCDEKNGRFGIRTVRLEQKPKRDPDGFTCQLLINETPVFLKGANWVPLDVMAGTITKDRYEKAIELAYEANFSMLRIWGGGIYENDIFYELCDKLGILVWQDFAYACADVPDNDFDFINRSIAEAEYQVMRLRNHPSLVIFCGGNEKTGSHGFNKKYGDKLIYYYIRGLVDHLDGTRPYFPSSPWGYGDIGNTQSSGDSHVNSYQKSLKSKREPNNIGIENFRDLLKTYDPSLASEIAVQGAPLLSSLRKYIPENDLWPIGDMINLHFMRNPYDGTEKYFSQIQQEVAAAFFGEIEGKEDFYKKSSTVHSELARADLEHHKAIIGRCSGTMTWMFNDTWPSGAWPVIDYYMTPMPAYYALKRCYTPQNLIITKTMKGYELFVVNETQETIGYNVKAGICDLSGKGCGEERELSGTIGAYTSVSLLVFGEDIPKNCMMYGKGEIGGKEYQTAMFGTLWKDVEWTDPQLEVSYTAVKDGVTAKLSAKNYARCVNLAVPGRDDLIYSDNYFDMLPGTKKTILIKGKDIDINAIMLRNWLDKWEY